LFDAIDGLEAWDVGCGSGIDDGDLRVRVEDHLAALEESDWENLCLAFIAELRGEEQGHTAEDLDETREWMAEARYNGQVRAKK